MPYAKWSDVNPAIQGIKPQVTLAMANEIAAQADAIEAAGTADNAWAAAIGSFKRRYKVRGGRWVRRQPRAREAGSMAGLRQDLEEAWREEADLEEQKTKAVGGRRLSRSDFLVQGEDDKPTTWSLPVKINGRPNRRLAAGAWAALFSPEGFRGNRYEGPDAGKAKTALKALYKAQGWEQPTEEAEPAQGGKMQEDWSPSDYHDYPSVPWNAKTFEDVDLAVGAKEATESLHRLVYQFGELARNVLNDSNPEVTSADKLAALKDLTQEFITRAGDHLDAVDEPHMEVEPGEAATVRIGETHAGAILGLEAAVLAEGAEGGRAVPMTMDVVLIEPGFGNTRDKNYYGREMLARDAAVFVGAKMYETDHRAAEKSNRTWVSQVDSIKGVTETGAPVAKVIVHDPSFAERARALKEAGKLETLECSILAGGLARKGKVDGKEANIVERITDAQSVDWVTKAGAGGRAVELSESGGGTMDRIVTFKVTGAAETDAPSLGKKLGEKAAELFGAGVKLEEVTLAEVTAPPAPDPKPTETPPTPEPTPAMEKAAVAARLAETSLPDLAKAKLSEAAWKAPAELDAAISKEIEYVKGLTGSGHPFGNGQSTPLGAAKPMTAEEADAEAKKIGEKFHIAALAG